MEVMEQLSLETKGKSCLTSLINLYDMMTGPYLKGRAMGIVYLPFSKAFDTVSRKSLLLEKLLMYRGMSRQRRGPKTG